MNWRSPDVSPLRHTSLRERDQNTVRPCSRLIRNVSAFIHAIIRTARVSTSCTMAATRPSALYFTRSRSDVANLDRRGDG